MTPRLLDMYWDDIDGHRMLSRSEKDCLVERLRNGDETAREQLVQAHLRLVVHEAKKYQWVGPELVDLIQEGNLGLMQAAHRFDPHYGTQFSTYAVWWIRQAIRQALGNLSLSVRMPARTFEEKFLKLKGLEKQLDRELGFAPPLPVTVLMTDSFTDQERGEFWCSWFHDFRILPALSNKFEKVQREVKPLLGCNVKVLSIDMEIPDRLLTGFYFEDEDHDQNVCLRDVTADLLQPEDEVDRSSLCRDMERCLSFLPAQEKELLENRFRFDADGVKTIQEYSLLHGLAPHQFRQMQALALSRLRHPATRRYLRDYLDDCCRFDDPNLFAGSLLTDVEKLPRSLKKFPTRKLSAADRKVRREHQALLEQWQKMTRKELIDELRWRFKPESGLVDHLQNWINSHFSPEEVWYDRDDALSAGLDLDPLHDLAEIDRFRAKRRKDKPHKN